MNIIETGLKFNGLRPRTSTSQIILHHSASQDVPAVVIHSWHLARGWAGIGYHFVIRKNGNIERGRPQGSIGAHAGAEVNARSIGICLSGDFTQAAPTEQQIAALLELIRWLNKYYAGANKELEINMHRDVTATQCPGNMFPSVEQIRKWLAQTGGEGGNVEDWKHKIMQDAGEAGLIHEQHQPDTPAPKWFVLAVALRILEIMNRE
ncbi:MAG: N-acetylmuramoyl-L-alanine amidase [Syntrophomonadaceae bacterium]|nr:N-acetylmuramoyl-L-alanine amidase [Syntrophomonadaceae bacterium]